MVFAGEHGWVSDELLACNGELLISRVPRSSGAHLARKARVPAVKRRAKMGATNGNGKAGR
jgi:hypothetical protein